MGEQITLLRGKWNIVSSSLENVENELKNITQTFGNRDVILVDSLSGLKYSHEDKELLNLLEPKEYEVKYKKILKREDISFQVIDRVEGCLKQSTVDSHFTLVKYTVVFHIFASTFHTAYFSWKNKLQIAKICYFPIWWKYLELDHSLGPVWI